MYGSFALRDILGGLGTDLYLVADGRGYAPRGIAGSFATGAGISIAACLVFGLLPYGLPRRALGTSAGLAVVHIREK